MHGMSRRVAAGLGHPMAGGECQDPRHPSFLWVDTWTWMKFVILPRDNIKTWESVRFYFVLSFFNLRIFSEHVSFGHKWRIYLGEHVNRCSQSNLRMLPKEGQCQPWFVRCIYPQERSFTWAVNHPFSTDKSVWTIGWIGWWWLILPAGLTLVSSWVVSEHVLANRNSWLTS